MTVETVDPSVFPPTASSSLNASRLVSEAIEEANGRFRGDRQQAKAAVNAGYDPRVAVKSLSPNLSFGSSQGAVSSSTTPTATSVPGTSQPEQQGTTQQTQPAQSGGGGLLGNISPEMMVAGGAGLLVVLFISR